MKTLLIIRHGHAEWKSTDGRDFSRKMDETGIYEVKSVAQQILQKRIVIDAIFYSSAMRTFQTAEILGNECGVLANNRFANQSLYHATAEKLENVIIEFPEALHTIAIVAHNPGVTDHANMLVIHPFMNSMPTGSVIAIKCNSNNWADFYSVKKELLFALSPS